MGGGIEVWPCCLQSVLVFDRMGTQWNVGPGGAVGLRYEALPIVLRACGVPAAQRASVFDDLLVLEDEALKTMREKRKKT